mmetsp:Transcript_56327/g.163383  ORF Transcript_56327/g.163383 Transcript_56327/m.163383 type:complete len:241 (+) Transcript_56327:837-1559(+)
MDTRSLCSAMPTTLDTCSRPFTVASAASSDDRSWPCRAWSPSCMPLLSFFLFASMWSMSVRISRIAASSCRLTDRIDLSMSPTTCLVSPTKLRISACILRSACTSSPKVCWMSLTSDAVKAAILFAACLLSFFTSTPIFSTRSRSTVWLAWMVACAALISVCSLATFATSMSNFLSAVKSAKASSNLDCTFFICMSNRRRLAGDASVTSLGPQTSSFSKLTRSPRSVTDCLTARFSERIT